MRNLTLYLIFVIAFMTKKVRADVTNDAMALVDASEAIWRNNGSASDLALIRTCSKWNPALGEYADWLKRGELDTKEQHAQQALDRLLSIATTLPQDKEEVKIAIARINYMRSENIWNHAKHQDAIALTQSIADLLAGCQNKEARKMEFLNRITLRFMQRINEGDSPLFWDDVNTLEQELQNMLSHSPVEDIVLYRILNLFAMIKSMSTYYIEYYNYVFGNDFLRKRGIYPDTNNVDFINSNSLWYFREAMRVHEKCATDDVINLALTINSKAIYVYNNKLKQYYDETIREITDMQKCLASGGKRGNVYAEILQPWKSLLEIRSGHSVTMSDNWQTAAKSVGAYLGEDTEEFFNYIENLSSVFYHQKKYDKLAEVEERMSHINITQIEQTHEKELMAQAMNLWEIHANMTDADFQKFVHDMVIDYFSIHKPSWSSVELGKLLATRLALELNDKEMALLAHETAFEDAQKLLPHNHLQLAFEYSYMTQNITDVNSQKLRDYTQAMEQIFNANNITHPLMLRIIAVQYSNIGEEAKAIALLQKAVSEAHKSGDSVAEAFCGIELALFTPNSPDCRKKMEKYTNMLLQTDEYQYHTIMALNNATSYFSSKNATDRLPAIYEKGRQLILRADDAASTESCQLYIDYANYFTCYNNDYDASLQLIEEIIGIYSRGNYSESYTELFELEKMKYNLLKYKGDGQGVLVKKLFCLKEMNDIAEQILQLSRQSREGMFTYMLDVLERAADMWIKYSYYKQLLESTPVGTKEYAGLKSTVATFKQVCDPFTPEFFDAYIKEFKNQYPDFLLDQRYYTLLSTYTSYCYNVSDDCEKGNALMHQLLNESKEHYPALYPGYLYAYIGLLSGTNRNSEAEALLPEYDRLTAGMHFTIDGKMAYNNMKYHIHHALGHYADCIAPATENFSLMQQLINLNFDMLTQQEREEIIQEKGTGASYISHLLERCPAELASKSYDAMLHEKNLLLRSSERIRQSVLRSGNQELISALDSINTLQALLRQNSGLGYESKGEIEQQEYLAIQKRMEELERRVARLSAPYRTDDRMHVTWKDVKNHLAKDAAAIEFVISETQTGMLIITSKLAQPVFVALTETAGLQHDMESLSALPAKQYAEALYESDRLHLYDRLWKPAEQYLSGVSTIYLSPTGLTNAIAFNAIKTPDGKSLIDSYDIHQMTSTAFLVLPEKRSTKAFSTAVFGGILYDEEQSAEASVKAVSAIEKNGHRGADNEAFSFLKGTIEEVEATRDLLNKKGDVKSYVGASATEQAFCSLSEDSPSLIHLATHGFFISATDIVDNTPYFDRYPNTKYHSMQRSGLAFANANDTWLGDTSREFANDGILNANEIAALDLSGTQLITMSACKTALGEYAADGVYGLQRGLKQAGVRSILASLWSVDDECTSVFMTSFYNSWINGNPLHKSLDDAIAITRQKYSSPYFWAAFVLLDGLD